MSFSSYVTVISVLRKYYISVSRKYYISVSRKYYISISPSLML